MPASGAHLLATRGPSCAVCGARSPWRVSADATPAREGRAPHTSAMMSGLLARLLQLLLRRKASSARAGSAIEAAPAPKVLVELRGRRWVARARLRVPERSPLTVAGDRVFSCASCRTHCGDADAVIAKARARARAARSGAAYARREPRVANRCCDSGFPRRRRSPDATAAPSSSRSCAWRRRPARRSASPAHARRARPLSVPNSRELTHQSLAAALRHGAPHVARGRALRCVLGRAARSRRHAAWLTRVAPCCAAPMFRSAAARSACWSRACTLCATPSVRAAKRAWAGNMARLAVLQHAELRSFACPASRARLRGQPALQGRLLHPGEDEGAARVRRQRRLVTPLEAHAEMQLLQRRPVPLSPPTPRRAAPSRALD